MTNTIRSLLSASILVGTATAAVADANPTTLTRDAMPATHGGLELAVSLGATTSTGDVGDGMTGGDLLGSAGQLELQIGHRITPNLTLGFYSSALAAGNGTYSGAAGVEADFHLRPYSSIDPWVSVGSGVSAYLIDDGDYTLGVGAELARLQVGVDFRTSKNFAFGPVVGASATLYGAEKRPMEDFHELSDKGINWTITGGVAVRFNLFTR